MSLSRHSTQLRTAAFRYPKGANEPKHKHSWHQLVYAGSGAASVETETGNWILPPQQALWVPAECMHRLRSRSALDLRTIYLKGRRIDDYIGATLRVVSVSPLARELILFLVEQGAIEGATDLSASNTRDGTPVHQALELVLFLLNDSTQQPLVLPWPEDQRAKRFANKLAKNPADGRDTRALAKSVGASQRTLERIFTKQTGLSLGQWQRQLRLHKALVLLAEGESVVRTAIAVGYSSPSAFVAMFKKCLGTTPARYFSPKESDR